MRAAGLVLVSALVLAACNPAGPGQIADSSAVFPDLTGASYRAEGTITHDAGTMPLVLIRSGAKQRVEMQTPAGATTMIMNPETQEAYVLSNAAGRQIAMRMSADQFDDPAEEWSSDVSTTARHTGSCAVAGETGAEWTHDNNGTPNTVCVTQDGIILRTREGERTTFEVTSVQRGPQSADLFALPAGVEVMDLGNIQQQMRQAIERAQSGQ